MIPIGFNASHVPPTPAAPVNVSAPSISGANYYTGTTLTALTGGWTGYPTKTYTYQWKRDGSNISGATSGTYVLVSGDETHTITVAVTATNTQGNSTATSAGIVASALPAAPINTVAPSISGTANTGQTLTAATGTWTGSPTPSYTYVWKRAGSAISGATASTYQLVSADEGSTITVTVTGTNSQGSASATSSATATVTPVASAPSNTVAPAITGTVASGSTLTSSTGTWAGYPTPTYAYQWKRAGANISGATSSTYTLVVADQGSAITVAVTATNASGNATATSSATSAVTGVPANTVAPTLSSSSANVGTAISVNSNGTWTGYPTPTYTYQWYWFDTVTPISGATSSSYTPISADSGHTLSCNVTGTNASGSATASTSATSAVTTGPSMPSGATYIHYADQYQSAGKVIPNAATAITPTPNILRFGRGGYSSPYWKKQGGVTVTDAFATGVTGLTTAARLVCSAGSNAYLEADITLPAGSYVCCFSAKSNTGSTQSVKLAQSVQSITTSWQRFVIPQTQATTGGFTLLAVWENGTGFDILVDDIAFYPGSSDLGVSNDPSGELWVDNSGIGTKSTISTGVVDFTTGDMGWLRLATAVNPSAGFTAGAFIKGSNTGTYGDILSMPLNTNNFTTFSLMTMEGSATAGTRAHVGNVSIVPKANGSTRFNAQSLGWHMLTYRFDGSTLDVFFDDVLLWTKTGVSGLTALALKDLAMMQVVPPPGYLWGGDFYYPTALTDTQVKTGVYATMRARMITNGITLPVTRTLVHDGDSISTSPGWIDDAYLGTDANADLAGTNFAIAGSTMVDLNTRLPQALKAYSAMSGAKCLYTFLIGANDLGTYTGATDTIAVNNWLAYLFAMTDQLRAVGIKVGACTVLPRTDTTFNTRRNIANPLLRSAVGTHLDFIIDFAAITNVGADADAADTAKYNGGLHPTPLTCGLMESDATYGYKAVVNAQL